jgi:hypothetical protein
VTPTDRQIRTELGLMIEQARAQGAKDWCIVTIDDESGKIVNVEGTFDDEISAIAEGQRQKNDAERGLPDGEKGWSYFAVPYFEREQS